MYEPSRRHCALAVVTAVSGVLAAALHVFGGTAVERVTGVFVGVAVAATLGVLYIHGQRRDANSDGGDVDDGTKRKQTEMAAEAGGYGGNAGG